MMSNSSSGEYIYEGGSAVTSVKTNLTFQPPNTIFEESLGSGSCPLLNEKAPRPAEDAINIRFCPRILSGLDDLLPGLAGSRPNGRYVGSIRVEVMVKNPAVDNISAGMGGGTSVEGTIELEDYLDDYINDAQTQQHQGGGSGKVPVLVPAVDANTGTRVGTFVLSLRVHANNTNGNRSANENNGSSSASGLVSIVGLDTLTEELGISPYLDCDAPPPNSQQVASPPTAAGIRRRQIATMGSFISPNVLMNQSSIRSKEASVLSDRYERYYQALTEDAGEGEEDDSDMPLFKRRKPRPFRPSNSRSDRLLSGIGFNVHVQSLSLNVLQDGETAMPAGVTTSVTHGAPADHSRGFSGLASEEGGGDSSSKDNNSPRGGLRRLESKRLEIAKELDDSVAGLINAVGEHFKGRSQATAMRQRAGFKPSRHVPPNLPAVAHYRTKAMDCTQRLFKLTWEVAVRRANCFSQALGIAVTSYLTSLSDGGPASRGYADVWVRHGYLITFEGLLSAVGKELGMIEGESEEAAVFLPSDLFTCIQLSKHSDSALQTPPLPSPCCEWSMLFLCQTIQPTPKIPTMQSNVFQCLIHPTSDMSTSPT